MTSHAHEGAGSPGRNGDAGEQQVSNGGCHDREALRMRARRTELHDPRLTVRQPGPHHPPVSTVAEILDEKGRDVITIDGDATVFDAVKAMVDANVGAVLVTRGGRIDGIFSERDYLRRI